jgi:hypothetical protein
MKYTVETGSGAMTYMTRFIKIGYAIVKLIWGETHTQSMRPHIPAFIFQNKESRPIKLISRLFFYFESSPNNYRTETVYVNYRRVK